MKTKLIELKENILVKPTKDTQYVLLINDLNLKNNYEVQFLFEKENVNVEIIYIYFLKKNQILNLTTSSNHKVPSTSCDVKIKGVLGDNCDSSYVGKIKIDSNAQQTNSYLHDDVLVIGKNTKNTSQPILSIEANDVSATHGATTGRINEDHVYYLQSRGFSRKEAENVIIEGFFEKILSKISDDQIRERVLSTL